MKGFGKNSQPKKKLRRNIHKIPSKEEIINHAAQFHVKGNISKASEYYKYFIKQGFKDERVFSNYGSILKDLGKLKEAESLFRKAIELNPDFAEAHCNLGNLLSDFGKLKEAESLFRKAIELNPDFAEAHCNLGSLYQSLGQLKEAESFYIKTISLDPNFVMAYFYLSTFQYSDKSQIWQNKLSSKDLLRNKSPQEKVYIYFALSNVYHKEKKYPESSEYLQLANNLKLNLYPSNYEYLVNKSQLLLLETKKTVEEKKLKDFPESIFIVGMPRSGTTLIESILGMNINAYELGEINIFEESFLKQKKRKHKYNLSKLYLRKANSDIEKSITINKWLYNYQYAGIISKQIPNAKIIHCYRNPLDNILSIYRANFAEGNNFSSSLVDCAKVYLDQEEIMTEYKNRFRSKIYDLNYDLLVSNPDEEIKSLITWLGWIWNDIYLSPHLNKRAVSTASSVQVRSPINSKSCGGWKDYKTMLKPAMEIITQKEKYKKLKY